MAILPSLTTDQYSLLLNLGAAATWIFFKICNMADEKGAVEGMGIRQFMGEGISYRAANQALNALMEMQWINREVLGPKLSKININFSKVCGSQSGSQGSPAGIGLVANCGSQSGSHPGSQSGSQGSPAGIGLEGNRVSPSGSQENLPSSSLLAPPLLINYPPPLFPSTPLQNTIANLDTLSSVFCENVVDESFEKFWKAYPRHSQSKQVVAKKWKSSKAAKFIDVILKDLKTRAELPSEPWTKGNPYIPYPTTYLNQRRWEAEDKGESNANIQTSHPGPYPSNRPVSAREQNTQLWNYITSEINKPIGAEDDGFGQNGQDDSIPY